MGSCVTLLEGYLNHWKLIRCLVVHRTLSSRSSHHLQSYRFTHDTILLLLLLLCSLSSWFSRYMDPSTTISRNYFVTPHFGEEPWKQAVFPSLYSSISTYTTSIAIGNTSSFMVDFLARVPEGRRSWCEGFNYICMYIPSREVTYPNKDA